MESYGQQGEDYIKQAEKKLKGGFFKNMFSNKADRLDEARELFEQAANSFKLAKMFERSCDAYLRAAKCEEDSKGDPSNYYMDAAHAQKKAGNMGEFIRISDQAINAFCKQ